ncbi:MAG: hypothetical protein TQ35_0005135 [Candidatus Aramenus sulfurataquae]|uniref:Uncharacterized protein n=3 Tax=Candidatus Aramenus sulfurataquae TaxID=1326980 RepID=A0A0F2LP86_9CREN|nr:hypothetical protein [Candidatus Aramenus sulfurataquae]
MQKREVCPYYKNGYCTSPMLDTPSDSVVSPQRCFKTYKGCRFYVDKGEEKQGLEVYDEERIEQEVKFYPRVNVLMEKVDSECQFFQLLRTNSGFIAYCKVLGRILTESSAELCSKYWQKCPIRGIE